MASVCFRYLLRPPRAVFDLASRARPVGQKSRLHLSAARLTIPRPSEEVGSHPPEWDGSVYHDKRGWFAEWLVGTPLYGEEQIGEYLYKDEEERIERARIQQQMEDYYFGDPPRQPPVEFEKYCMEFLIKCDDENGVRTLVRAWEWTEGPDHWHVNDKDMLDKIDAYLERKRKERWYL